MITKKAKLHLGRSQPLLVAIFCVVITLVLFTPNITLYSRWMDNSTLSYIVKQIENPFVMHGFANNFSHEAKLGLRLTVPLIMKLMFIKDYKTTFYLLYFLKVIMGVILFRDVYNKLLELNCSKKLSLLFLLNLSVIYLGYSFTRNTVHFDEIGYFLIYFAHVNKHVVVQGLCIFLAVFTDERAIFSIILILIIKLRIEKRVSSRLFGLIIIFFLTLISRHIIGNLFNLFPRNNDGGIILFQLIRELRYSEMLLGLFFSFKLLWLFLIITRDNLFDKSSMVWCFSLFCLITAYILVGFSVIDVTRTITYLFPILIFPVLYFGIPTDFKVLELSVPTHVLLVFNLIIPSIHVESSINVPINVILKIVSMKLGIMPI